MGIFDSSSKSRSKTIIQTVDLEPLQKQEGLLPLKVDVALANLKTSHLIQRERYLKILI